MISMVAQPRCLSLEKGLQGYPRPRPSPSEDQGNDRERTLFLTPTMSRHDSRGKGRG